jgi:hypothetical protein
MEDGIMLMKNNNDSKRSQEKDLTSSRIEQFKTYYAYSYNVRFL